MRYGIQKRGTKLSFSLYSASANELTLALFLPKEKVPILEVPMQCQDSIWSAEIQGEHEGHEYAFKIDNTYYLDPYASHITTDIKRGIITSNEPFNWEGVSRPFLSLDDLIIYEMHVKGFTPSGTFNGIREKIPYLRDLGITAVELMPIMAFDDSKNYWGYSSLSFFAIMEKYGTIKEFKELVKALHVAKIEIILDVVYNHTGDTCSLMGIDRENYYTLQDGNHTNYSGCGNTIRANHPATQELILDSLRYFVSEMHVDGFRFDLASTLTRAGSNLIDRIAKDPILAKTKLIAEPWDPGGLYQVGSFHSRFLEWNGQYRDEVRNFIKGTGNSEICAKRLLGSPDLYHNPSRSVNFITSHDGFTLSDLVSYNEKHNELNGEANRDGSDHNISWNCGVEGETEDEEILALRSAQMKNFLLALFVSKGVPMLHMGDEYGHTKKGNNNTWCQDTSVSYFEWGKDNSVAKELIALRKKIGPLSVYELQDRFIVLVNESYIVAFNAKETPQQLAVDGRALQTMKSYSSALLQRNE